MFATADVIAGGRVGNPAGEAEGDGVGVCARTGVASAKRTHAVAATTRGFTLPERPIMNAEFPPARLAASVILVRTQAAGFSVLMLRRSPRSPFAPGAFVFPGGTLDPADYEGPAPRGWDRDRIEREFRAAADAVLPSDQPAVSESDAYALVRAAVREVAEEANVVVDAEALHLFSHWITPAEEPRRYNTHFFVTSAPHEQQGEADAFETHDAFWVAPADALARYARGELHLLFPTIKHLELMSAFDSAGGLLDFARTKNIVTIMPAELANRGTYAIPESLEGTW
jgi:8-oxo-dGTP pyrophosphatase MutT (NUDIX family)